MADNVVYGVVLCTAMVVCLKGCSRTQDTGRRNQGRYDGLVLLLPPLLVVTPSPAPSSSLLH